MSTLDTAPEGSLSPSLALGANSGGRYPNQFFDLSQQYMPPTIKELFKWCTFYFYNSPLIGAAIKKVSRYPITDIIFEDEHESVRSMWKKVLVDVLKMKDRLMEVNLDYHVYGNAFVSLHLPFTRFLICMACKHRAPISQWDWTYRGAVFNFYGKCTACGVHGACEVKDVPFKDWRQIRLIRWNPENIHIKFNEYTGRYTYMYTVPAKLKNAIFRGDRDILEDIPLIVLEACKKRRMIRFSPDALKHLKNPTLAEQDQGWGKPSIIHVLKDMYYFYTLRRAQEAIAMEHIVPFDIIYPMPNGQQDPYMHTDLSNWRMNVENIIKRHRRDPNFKAVIPIPVGFGRLGGDGKALLLSPELNYVTQTVVGGMGIPQEFLFGGLNFTGSSISLRTLENDFIQNRSQLLDLLYWIKDKVRMWTSMPNLNSMRFADFRMADDVQKNQQLIGLNAQGKVSDQTLLTELGYDYDDEVKKIIEETYVRNYITDLQSKGAAKSQGEAMIIQTNYQQKVQELAQKAQASANERLGLAPNNPVDPQTGMPMEPQPQVGPDGQPSGGAGGGPAGEWGAGGGQPGPGSQTNPAAQPIDPATGQPMDPMAQMQGKIQSWARKLTQMQPAQAKLTIAEIKTKMPDIGRQVEQAYNQELAGGMTGGEQPGSPLETAMKPLPEKGAPMRQDVVGA